MKFSAFVGAAVAAVTLAVAAPAAAAITLTFKVTLDPSKTLVEGAAAGLSPAALEFEETWTFEPTLSSTPGVFAPPGNLVYNYRDAAAVGEITDPVADAAAAAGLAAGESDYSRATFKNRRGFDADGNRTFAASEFELDQQQTLFDSGAGGLHIQNQSRYIFGAQGAYLASSLYDNALIEFLTGRTLTYRVTGSDTLYDADFNVVSQGAYVVEGTAVLLSYSGLKADPVGGPTGRETYATPPAGVPEPATWALMIGGFGLAGARLRRRRVVA